MQSNAVLCPWLALASLLALPAVAATVNFDAAAPGQPPPGWTAGITGSGEPRWTVEADASAVSAPNVLRQSGEVPKPSFPVCLLDAPTMRDGAVEVKFKTVSGTNDQAAGVVWRAKDAQNYYLCRANALEENIVLYKVVEGKRTALDVVGRKGGYGVGRKVLPARWQALRVEFAAGRFKVRLDGVLLFEVEDATFPDAGKLGLWTKADSVTLFDDFRYDADGAAQPGK